MVHTSVLLRQIFSLTPLYCQSQGEDLALFFLVFFCLITCLLFCPSYFLCLSGPQHLEIIGQADGGLSVLRTFRLLRVLKLVRFMPALRRQLVVLMKTMDNVATFCMLLMLFIFIFR